MTFIPHNYQHHTVEHIVSNRAAGVFLEMGLGKTISTLTAIKQLMFEDLDVEKVLVIAPKKVAQSTWTDEIQKWDHTRQLTISVVIGTERKRIEALRAKADIYTINRENVAWLVSYFGEHGVRHGGNRRAVVIQEREVRPVKSS